jgi:hypothetical protein
MGLTGKEFYIDIATPSYHNYEAIFERCLYE